MKSLLKVLEKYFYVKILLPTFLTISLFITAIFFVVIPQFENIILDRKREMIQELTNSAVSMINKWYQLKEEGLITEEEAKSSAKKIIRSLRYGEESKDYFWITDSYPNMIAHPYRPELEGNSLKLFEDSHGKKLFVKMAEQAKQNGEGYVDYMWQWKDDSTTIVPKLSYVKMFSPWNWIVGTGIYIEDVKVEISKLEQKIINISIIITIISSILLVYIAYQNLRSEKRRKKVEDELKDSRERYRMLVEHSNIGIIMVLENKQIFFNKTIYKMLGYSSHENSSIILAELFKNIPSSNSIDFNTLKIKNNSGSLNEQIETMLLKQNGESINVLLDISPIEFSSSNGIVINIKDITLDKEIEEALDSTKGKYLSLTNQISIGVFRVTGNKLQFSEVNPALAELLGYSNHSDLISLSFTDFFDDNKNAEKFINDILKEKVIKNRITKLVNIKNEIINVSVSAVLNGENSDYIESIDGIIEDITEQYISDRERDELITDLQTSILVLSKKINNYVKPIFSCKLNCSVLEAAKIMELNKTSTLLIKGDADEELGIVTHKDLTERFIVNDKKNITAIYNFMSAPLESIGTNNSIYDAIIKFTEKQINALLVKDLEDNTIGFIDLETIYKASYSNYLFFINEIENTGNIKVLEKYRNRLLLMVNGLIKNDGDINTITKINSIVSDAITKRIIKNVINEIGEPPCKFAFIVMGSEGRKEQTLSTDQDNAIIFEDVSEGGIEEYQNYFLRLGERISEDLNTVGYKYCKGNIMAKNIKWCQPFTVWKKYFTGWITEANPKDLLELKIFFDFRFIYGEKKLSTDLFDHVNHLINSFSPFLLFLAESVLKFELPDAAPKMKSALDIKLITLPVVDFARLYGLKFGLNTNNTLDRLEYVKEKGLVNKELIDNISFSYHRLMQIRLKNQSDCISDNKFMGNEINPNELSEIYQMIIKKYFEFLDDLKEKIRLDFKGTIIR